MKVLMIHPDFLLGDVDQKPQSYFPRSSFRIVIAILGDKGSPKNINCQE